MNALGRRADEVAVFATQLARYGTRPPHLLLACQAKVGSTFLASSLSNLPGMRRAKLTPGADRREQELCELKLRRLQSRAYVAQHHVRRSSVTDALVRRHGLSVIVLTRDLFDAVVSLRDHVRQESVAFPMAYITEHHRALPDAELEVVLARLAVPWYVNFYMSWRDCPYATYVSYAELIEDPARQVRRIAEACGLSATDAEIEAAVSTARGARLNVGVNGRGAALAPQAKAEILAQLACYPEAAADPYIRHMKEAASAPTNAA